MHRLFLSLCLLCFIGTKACEKFGVLVLNAALLKDVAKISPHQQTSSIEAFHSLILRFAPKNVVFPYIGMLCRLVFFCFDLVRKHAAWYKLKINIFLTY